MLTFPNYISSEKLKLHAFMGSGHGRNATHSQGHPIQIKMPKTFSKKHCNIEATHIVNVDLARVAWSSWGLVQGGSCPSLSCGCQIFLGNIQSFTIQRLPFSSLLQTTNYVYRSQEPFLRTKLLITSQSLKSNPLNFRQTIVFRRL